MINEYEKTSSSIIGVQTVADNETNRYGIIDPTEKQGRLYRVNKFVEKPEMGKAPSLAIMGRFIFTSEIF